MKMEQESRLGSRKEGMETVAVQRILDAWQEQFQAAGLILDHNAEYFIVRSSADLHGNVRYIPKWEWIPVSGGKKINIDDALKNCLNDSIWPKF